MNGEHEWKSPAQHLEEDAATRLEQARVLLGNQFDEERAGAILTSRKGAQAFEDLADESTQKGYKKDWYRRLEATN